MTAHVMLDHRRQLETDMGTLCSCGDLVPDWLEHLGAVALLLLNAPARIPRPQRATPRPKRRYYRHEPRGWASPSDRIDELMNYGLTDAAIAKRLAVPLRLIRARRAPWLAVHGATAQAG